MPLTPQQKTALGAIVAARVDKFRQETNQRPIPVIAKTLLAEGFIAGIVATLKMLPSLRDILGQVPDDANVEDVRTE